MKALTQTQQQNFNRLTLSLPEYIGNKQKQNWQPTIHNRLIHATELQTIQKQSKKAHKDLTEYANWLLANKYSDLCNIIYDYTGSRMYITGLKHEILINVREHRLSNVSTILKNRLTNEVLAFVKSGAMRTSDANVLSGKFPNKTKY